jgi:hypothetical protein
MCICVDVFETFHFYVFMCLCTTLQFTQLLFHPQLSNVYAQLSQASREALSSLSSQSFGIPENSKHFMILGRLFKVHPVFDDVLFDILLNTAPNVYIVVVRESNNIDLNSELYVRWKVKQTEICCEAAGNMDPSISCCGRMHSYKDYFQEQHEAMLTGGSDSDTAGTMGGKGKRFSDRSYVLHRLRFVHYNYYVQALMSATAVLDTFP